MYPVVCGSASAQTTEAICSGSAIRPVSVARPIAWIPASPTAASIGVFTGPGATALIRAR